MEKDPKNYYHKVFPFGCISICGALGFKIGSSFKYVYRCLDKDNKNKDLNKAISYIEMSMRERHYNSISKSKMDSLEYKHAVIDLDNAIGESDEARMQISIMKDIVFLSKNCIDMTFDEEVKFKNKIIDEIKKLIEIKNDEA